MDRTSQIESIAREYLRIPTLEDRHSDALDFHDVAVWDVANALSAAFEAGMRQHRPPTPQESVQPSDSRPSHEATNETRANRISKLLLTLRGLEEDHTCLVDLLADAMHWCDHTGGDFHLALAQACRHYIQELNDEPTDQRRQ